MMDWLSRIDTNGDMNITESEIAGAVFLNYDKIDQLMHADTNGNGNVTFDEFCALEFGEATIFCGHMPEYDQLIPDDFLDTWYRYIDKNADEIGSFDEIFQYEA